MTLQYQQVYLSAFTLIFLSVHENIVALMLLVLFAFLVLTNQLRLAIMGPIGLYPFLGILVVSMFSTAALSPFEFNPYFIARDMFYFLAPVTVLFIGFSLGNSQGDGRRLLWSFVICVTGVSVIEYGGFFLSGGFLSLSLSARYVYGINGDLATLACIVLLVCRYHKFALSTTPRLELFILLLNLYMAVVSLSRVNLGVLLILFLFLAIRRRSIRTIATSVIFAIVFLPFISTIFVDQAGLVEDAVSFWDKVFRSFGEVGLQDYTTLAEQNQNWRGYEAFLGYNAVVQNGVGSIVAGLGLGSFVEGPFQYKLTIIPIFHNGYITILAKGGAIGVFLFLLFLAKLGNSGRRMLGPMQERYDENTIAIFTKLPILLVLAIALKTLVTHGLLTTKLPIELLLVGLIAGIAYRLQTTQGINHAAIQNAPVSGHHTYAT